MNNDDDILEGLDFSDFYKRKGMNGLGHFEEERLIKSDSGLRKILDLYNKKVQEPVKYNFEKNDRYTHLITPDLEPSLEVFDFETHAYRAVIKDSKGDCSLEMYTCFKGSEPAKHLLFSILQTSKEVYNWWTTLSRVSTSAIT
jgi:hypothetical protein